MTSPAPKATKKPMIPRIKKAWEDYFATKDEEAKSVLVAHYQFLVKHIMRPFWHKKPFLLDHDDLLQAGNIGLIQAIERYSDDRDAMFETFAQLRIRGAILDEINSLDWTPRSVRKNIRAVIKAEEGIISSGDEASVDRLAAETGLSTDEVKLARNQANRTFVLPVNQDSLREMETHLSENEADLGFARFANDENDRNARDSWLSLMSSLNDQEQRVILLRFYYEETMVKTAKILHISPNSVSSLQASAFNKIRHALANQKED